MIDKLLHGIQARIGYLGFLQTVDNGGPRQPCEDVVDDFLKRIAVLHSLGRALKARVGGHVAALQYLLAKAGPFALILDRQVHGLTIAGNERTIWCNRSVLGPCAWRLRSTV